jgi:hypothetical protein
LKLAPACGLGHPLPMNMLPIELRIDRALRLLRMIEEDAPLLEMRVAPLSREHQESAKSHAQLLAELTRAELQKLHREKALTESADATA